VQTLVETWLRMDVHQATVVACLLVVFERRENPKADTHVWHDDARVLTLREWLLSEGCTHVAMESTGVYWKPIYAILEEPSRSWWPTRAHTSRRFPGRKTDVKDAEWIADLLCHGLGCVPVSCRLSHPGTP